MLFLHLQTCIFNLHLETTLENVFSGSWHNLDGACSSTKIYFCIQLYKLKSSKTAHKINHFHVKKSLAIKKWIYLQPQGGCLCPGWNCPYITHALFFKHHGTFLSGKRKKATEHYWYIDLDFREFECPDCVVYFQLESYRKIIIVKPDFFSNTCSFSTPIYLSCFFSSWEVLNQHFVCPNFISPKYLKSYEQLPKCLLSMYGNNISFFGCNCSRIFC